MPDKPHTPAWIIGTASVAVTTAAPMLFSSAWIWMPLFLAGSLGIAWWLSGEIKEWSKRHKISVSAVSHRKELAVARQQNVETLPLKPEINAGQKRGRSFVPAGVTPERLLSFFDENTTMQATELTKRYVGQWMQVTAAVRNVGSFTGYFVQVALEKHPQQLGFTYCLFDEPWIDHLQALKRGDKITVIGQVKSIEPMTLNLAHCELVADSK